MTIAPALAAMVFLPACRQVLDIRERAEVLAEGGIASSPTRGACGSFTYPTAACSACMDASCCGAVASCQDDPTCEPTLECLLRCAASDSECSLRCRGSFGRPDSLADLMACRAKSCNDACGLRAGGLGSSFNACDDCVEQTCAVSSLACAQNAECIKVDFCNKNCLPAGSITCSQACQTLHPEGTDAFAERSACASNSCTSSCQPQDAWTCLDAPIPQLKPTRLDPIHLSLSVVEFQSEQPYAGLTVKACARGDLPCTSPIATATTDASGIFEMDVALGNTGFDGYLDLSGSSLYPALYYFVPPLLVGGARGRLRLPSAMTFDLLVGALKIKADPARGHLALVPQDCSFTTAAGVSFSVLPADPASTLYYFVGGFPNGAATQTAGDPAVGGFVNLQPGSILIKASVVARDGKESAELNLNIRAGTLTTGSVPPSPPR